MYRKTVRVIGVLAVLAAVFMPVAVSPVLADPHTGQSVHVVIIGGSSLSTDGSDYTAANVMGETYGGFLPVTGSAGELGDFSFTAMVPASVSAASLSAFDTAVLNVASVGMACNSNTLTAQQQADLVAFVALGKKLIIYDSECETAVNYGWLPFPFTTANPGAMGEPGTLTIVENDTLASNVASDVHFIDAAYLGGSTDAVGDMNVLTTYNPNWCLSMSGTNYLRVTGPVHTYAKYPSGTDAGLIIYNGLDQDYQWSADPWLRKIWVQELQQPFNPSNLPCGYTVVGITIAPLSASNPVGGNHTVTALVSDLLGQPVPGTLVTFTVISGPNAGAAGTCSANADCTTDATGHVSFTYADAGGAGTDEIKACFLDQGEVEVCSQVATKEWGGQAPFVPEASTLLLLASGLTGVAGYVGLQIRARRRK